MSDLGRKVFRVRKLPSHLSTPQQAAQLLGTALGVHPDHVLVYSLAITSDLWETPPTKVATLQFHRDATLGFIGEDPARQEWDVALSGESGDKLVLDTHFGGLTVLNHVEPSKHCADCIAISGLASHAFGSWQPHGGDKSYMWIRDEISKSLPGVRAIIYGYDSKIIGSNSFQSIGDIALGLIHHLKAGRWNLPSAKPIFFLAHSLGGIVLKEALVQIADRDITFSSIIENVRGAIMFGVPSLGMLQSHLMALAEGQANECLIQDLSRENGSTYLRQLNKSFEGISFTRRARIFWAYETKESRTVTRRPDGTWDRNGPSAVLVNPDSATCNHNQSRKNKTNTIPINEDHTNMVKFSRGEPNLGTVMTVLADLCLPKQEHHTVLPSAIDSETQGGANFQSIHAAALGSATEYEGDLIHKPIRELGKIMRFIEELQAEIYSPELDFRIDSIQDPFQNTFRWIFDLPEFSHWLLDGSGLFWIHGKPGSGKSTLMKYIFRSKRTWDLLHDWTRGALEVRAGFFFHYRGTALQKSFEGVLRSLTLQILSHFSRNFRRQHQATWDSYAKLLKRETKLGDQKKKVELAFAGIENSIIEVRERHARLNTDDQVLNRNILEELKEKQLRLQNEHRDVETELAIVQGEMLPIANVYWPSRASPEAKFLSDLASGFQKDENELIFKLEKLLRILLDQNIKYMDLVLFFDALDEFDGHLGRLSKFITSLTNVSSHSTTRVRICLSSRPRETLRTNFSHYQNFSLQDFTKPDITAYATTSLEESRISNPSILELIPIVILKANGVFLWVKLAIQELLSADASGVVPASRQYLEQRLKMLPNDLQDFYTLIIERISPLNRRKTYVLLELLIRQQDPQPTAEHIRRAVLTSDCATWQEAQEELEKDDLRIRGCNKQSIEEIMRNDFLTWGGGLVEIKRNYPQFMHQTVLELVQGLAFKKTVLGNYSSIYKENGHSFHLKYWVSDWGYNHKPSSATSQPSEWRRIGYHAEHSELTTGNSHLEFLSSVPSQFLKELSSFNTTLETSDQSLLAFMSYNGLSLCLRDWSETQSADLRMQALGSIQAPLLSTLVFPSGTRAFHEGCLTASRLLLENGYSMRKDTNFFPTLLRKLWNSDRQGSCEIPGPVAHQLAVLALDNGQDPNFFLLLPTGTKHNLKCTPLHVAPPCLAKDLIRHGSHINAQDSTGRTPLDWAVNFPRELFSFRGAEWDCARRYEQCRILTSAGGVVSFQTERAWAEALIDFAKEGYDTQVLLDNVQCYRRGGTWGDSISQLFSLGRW